MIFPAVFVEGVPDMFVSYFGFNSDFAIFVHGF